MKVLFLDIDGVLNSMEFFARLPSTRSMCEVDPKAVKRVLRVLEVTGAKLVLSSTWRLSAELVERLRAVGLPIYDMTPSLGTEPRYKEIGAWLVEHMEATKYAIIDDDTDAEIKGRFVRTHPKYGMYGKHEKALIALLGEKESA